MWLKKGILQNEFTHTAEGEVETRGSLSVTRCTLTYSEAFILPWSVSLTFSSLLSLTFKKSESL